jgi:transcriptional regulator with XRE-family HTH domain
MADNHKIEMRTLIREARKNHHVSLAHAINSSKSSLSRYETGKSELAVDVLQDVFERVGLSFFDLHVQTDDLSPIWQRTCDQLRVCIGRNDYHAAQKVCAQYESVSVKQPSPLHAIYMILFKCMAALCQLTQPSSLLLSNHEQHVIMRFFQDTQSWQMLEFTLFQYTQWFLQPDDANQIFMGMCANINNKRLKDPTFLYRLAFFDAAIAYTQSCLLQHHNADFALRRLQQTRLLFHTNTERQVKLQIIELVTNQLIGIPSRADELTNVLNMIHELGMTHQYARLHWWAEIALKGDGK